MFYEKRLIEIYNQSSNFFYNNKKNFSEKSKHWSSYYDSQDFNLYNLKNFRNSKNNLSRGLDSTGKNFTFKLYSEIINKVSENYLLNNLPKENIGNSDYLIPYKNCFLDTNKLIHIYWFWVVENKILKGNKIKFYGYSEYTLRALNEYRKMNKVVRARIKHIKAPGLIIHSTADKTSIKKNMDIILNRITNKKTQTLLVNKAHHNMFDENLDQNLIFERVLDFLNNN